MTTLIRFNSHRAREKAQRAGLLAGPCHFSWGTSSTGGFYPVRAEDLASVLAIKGASKASQRFNYQECWH